MAHQILYQTLKINMFFDINLVTLKATWTGRTVPLVTSLPSSCYMTKNYSRDFCRPGRPTTVPDDIRAQEVNSKRFWRENWWLVAFGYSMCCRVSNVTKAQSVNTNPPQSSWCMLFSSPWTFTTVQCWAACCLGVFGFSHVFEFTVNSHFNPGVHIAVGDVQAESLVNSGSFRIYIKCSKMDPFC